MNNELAIKVIDKNIKSVKIESFIINKDGERIYDYFKSKKIKEKPTKIYSITKSVISILVGIMLDKGLINNVHTPIYHYFPEIDDSVTAKKSITIHHLLTMTSGLKWDDHGEGGGALGQARNWVKFVLEQPMVHEPGEVFQYSCGSSHLLSAIIHRVSGMPTEAFAKRYLFKPLKISNYNWLTDPQGIHGGGFSLWMNIEDLLKLGELYLQKGNYKGGILVSSDWVEESQSLNKVVDTTDIGSYGYGYQWWTYTDGKSGKDIRYYFAMGLFGQYIMIVPQLNMVASVRSQLKREDSNLPLVYFNQLLESYDFGG